MMDLALLEACPDAMVAVYEGRVVHANQRSAAMFGYALGDLAGRSIDELMRSGAQAVEAAQVVQAVARPGQPVPGGLRSLTGVRRDGRELSLEVTFQPIELEGRGAMLVAIRDLTEREREREGEVRELRAREAMMSAVLDASPDATLVVDAGGAIVMASRAVDRVFGWPAAQLLGRGVEVLVPGGVRDLHAGSRAQYAVQPRQRPMGGMAALHGVRRDGTEFPVDIALSPVTTASGALVIASVRDATARRQHEVERIASERMATIGMIAASVGHEINNPLAAVIGNVDFVVDLLRDPGVEDRGRWCAILADAQTAAARVQRIVRDIQLVTRVRVDVEAPADPRSVLSAVVRMASSELRHRARVVEQHEDNLRVVADEARLGQVLLNLVINAAQAMPRAEAKTHELRLSTRAAGSGFIEISVADTGDGMTEETLARLFLPFYTTKPAGEGTGLGLTISHRIVAELGGRIEVTSELGRGSEFRVYLPAAAAEVPAPTVEARVVLEPGRRGRLLVVDDEPMIGRVLSRVFARDHDVMVAEGIGAAERWLTDGARFDVILCDASMAGVPRARIAAEAARLAAELAPLKSVPVTPIVFMTGPDDPLGNTGHTVILKPFDLDQVGALIRSLVRDATFCRPRPGERAAKP